jgi:ABC-2 type transport system permease protein
LQAELTATRALPAVTPVARKPWWRQFMLILQVQFSDYRDSAAMMLLFSLAMPVGLMWLMGDYVGQRGTGATWFLAGNACISLAFGSANFALWRVGQLRLNKELDFYATLPTSKSAFLAALFCMAQLTALPGVAASLLAGHFMLDIPLAHIVAGLPVVLVSAACFTVVGATAGALATSFGRLNLYGNLITFLVIFLSPAMVPLERLPLVFRWTSYILPAGQATLALAEAFAGRFGQAFWLYAGALGLWLVVAGVVGLRKLDWRAD